jgi:hypothetical protein
MITYSFSLTCENCPNGCVVELSENILTKVNQAIKGWTEDSNDHDVHYYPECSKYRELTVPVAWFKTERL